MACFCRLCREQIGFLFLAMSFPEVVLAGSFSDVWLLTGGVGMSFQLWQRGMFTATLNADRWKVHGCHFCSAQGVLRRLAGFCWRSWCSSSLWQQFQIVLPASRWSGGDLHPRAVGENEPVHGQPGLGDPGLLQEAGRRCGFPPRDGRCRYQLLGNVLLLVCQQQQRSPLQRWPHHNGRDLGFEGKWRCQRGQREGNAQVQETHGPVLGLCVCVLRPSRPWKQMLAFCNWGLAFRPCRKLFQKLVPLWRRDFLELILSRCGWGAGCSSVRRFLVPWTRRWVRQSGASLTLILSWCAATVQSSGRSALRSRLMRVLWGPWRNFNWHLLPWTAFRLTTCPRPTWVWWRRSTRRWTRWSAILSQSTAWTCCLTATLARLAKKVLQCWGSVLAAIISSTSPSLAVSPLTMETLIFTLTGLNFSFESPAWAWILSAC